jgi:hypothetical protein
MIYKKMALFCIFSLLLPACESLNPKSRIEKAQTSQVYYSFRVLLTPDNPRSPKMDVALSLFQIKYPPAQTAFVNQLLYSGADPASYKDRVVKEQRDYYRKALSFLTEIDSENFKIFDLEGEEIEDLESSNWHYTENFAPISPKSRGIVIERTKETYTGGGAHGMKTTRYFVIDLEAQKLLKIDDFVRDYQGDQIRNLIYEELRKYSGLERDRPLSDGIFLNDEPELTFNFFINEEGLGLHWDPYEIAPYAEGAIQVMLPWKKVRPLLLNSGMELLAKFNIHLFV